MISKPGAIGGFAGDYVAAMWLMLQQEETSAYVIASGVSHSVWDLVELAFGYVALERRECVRTDAGLLRGTAELHNLIRDASSARARLGWQPPIDFGGLVRRLVDADLGHCAEEDVAAHTSPREGD